MILSRTVGIDLGTTNSAIAMLHPNERDLLIGEGAQRRASIPSCVWSDPRTGEIVVGHKAFARRGGRPEPITSIKRSMGTQIGSLFAGRDSSPVEISAHILRTLKRQMQDALATAYHKNSFEINRAIITVPAYFGLAAIEATRQAGELAGLEIAELLHEPTAAAIYHCWKHDLGDGVYLIYDLGGGTFDVSILRRIAGEFVVLGIAGDNLLGGDDIDRRLAEHLRRGLLAEGYDMELDVAGDPEDRLRFQQLVALAEQAKKQLSTVDEFLLRDQASLRDRSGTSVVVEVTLTRDQLDHMVDDLLDRTIDLCGTAIGKARERGGVTADQIDHVVLIGGSTYLPAVVEKVRRAFCAEGPTRTRAAAPVRDEPEKAVALGAALRAGALGLGLGDDDRRVRVWLRTPGATRREQSAVSGDVTVLRPDVSLVDGWIRLLTPEGDLVEETELASGLRFVFPRVPLRPEVVNDFRLQVVDGDGNEVAEVRRSISHSSTGKLGVSATLSTGVLPMPILLEGTDGDRVVRQVLLAEGSQLPARARFTFRMADSGGRLRLPIYQENRIIKELCAEIGEAPAGTPVEIEIECDDRVHVEVRVTVNGLHYGGRIEPPPPESAPTDHEIHHLDRSLAEALGKLSGEEHDKERKAYDRIRGDLEEARRGGDQPKVIQRAADLNSLLRSAVMRQPLEPPLAGLEAKYRSCYELLPEATRLRPELAGSDLPGDLEHLLTQIRAAHTERDKEAYAQAAGRLSAILDFLTSVADVDVTIDRRLDVTLRAAMAVRRLGLVLAALREKCQSTGRTDLAEMMLRYLREAARLEADHTGDPVRVLNRCQVLMSEAQQAYAAVTADAASASRDLGGLLRLDDFGHAVETTGHFLRHET